MTFWHIFDDYTTKPKTSISVNLVAYRSFMSLYSILSDRFWSNDRWALLLYGWAIEPRQQKKKEIRIIYPVSSKVLYYDDGTFRLYLQCTVTLVEPCPGPRLLVTSQLYVVSLAIPPLTVWTVTCEATSLLPAFHSSLSRIGLEVASHVRLNDSSLITIRFWGATRTRGVTRTEKRPSSDQQNRQFFKKS